MSEDDFLDAFKALAHPLRWRILASLANGERNVGDIELATGIGQPGLSQQLGVLRKAGLVETRKDAKLVFYTITAARIEAAAARIAALAPNASPAAEGPATIDTPAPGVANFARMF